MLKKLVLIQILLQLKQFDVQKYLTPIYCCFFYIMSKDILKLTLKNGICLQTEMFQPRCLFQFIPLYLCCYTITFTPNTILMKYWITFFLKIEYTLLNDREPFFNRVCYGQNSVSFKGPLFLLTTFCACQLYQQQQIDYIHFHYHNAPSKFINQSWGLLV